MRIVFECCCGMDVHRDSVTVCLLQGPANGTVKQDIRTFATTTEELLRLSDWLTEEGCTHVAIESTGVFWKPVFNILEGAFEVWVINTQHLSRMPGRKTDVQDSEWLADLMRHGLLSQSFVPPIEIREMRELTRYRKTLTQDRSREINRLQKVLECANIKLAGVVADVVGASGKDMLRAMISGEEDAARLADLARRRLKGKREELIPALTGRVTAHHRFMLQQHLRRIEDMDAVIETLNQEIATRMRPFEDALRRLDEIPGVGRRTAEDVVAEIGVDMTRFPTDRHLASWAGLCPGHHESGGKRVSGKTRKGSPWLRAALMEASWAAIRKKESYFRGQYARIKGRRGAKKAAVAVAHSLLVITYHILRDPRTTYRELGESYFEQRNRSAVQRRLVRRLEKLGFKVDIHDNRVAA